MLKDKRAVSKKEVNATLKSIYNYRAGKKLDMQIHRAANRSRRRILIGLIVFFGMVSVVSWLGVLVFSKFGAATDNLKLEISGEQNPAAGKSVEYEIKYKNNENFSVSKAEIALYLPKTFVLASSTPQLGTQNTLKIGTVKTGESGSLKITGKFFAAEGSKEILRAVLNYKPSNFNSNFQKTTDLEIEVSGSVFDGSLDAPDKVIAGIETAYALSYSNKSNSKLEKVAIEFSEPSDFSVSTSTLQLDESNYWQIGDLEPGAEGTIKVTGVFSPESKGAKEIIFKLGIFDETGAFLGMIEKKASTEVVGSDLQMSMLANGANNSTTVGWGKPLNYSITYKNNGKDSLSNVKISVKIAASKEDGKSIIDWSGLSDSYGGSVQGEKITWTKSDIPGLAKLAAGQGGTIDFSVNVISKPKVLSYTDYKIESWLEASIERAGGVAVNRTLQGGKITLLLNSDADFSSTARYYDSSNNVVGSGPIPPKVGEKTTYKIYWKATNSMHDLEDLKITGDLPDGVVFTGASTDTGSINLDSSLKKVVWTLNKMPASTGSISAQFDLTITPDSGDVGKSAGLLENVTFTAKDSSTGGTITIDGGDETTALPDDPFVSKGEVTP